MCQSRHTPFDCYLIVHASETLNTYLSHRLPPARMSLLSPPPSLPKLSIFNSKCVRTRTHSTYTQHTHTSFTSRLLLPFPLLAFTHARALLTLLLPWLWHTFSQVGNIGGGSTSLLLVVGSRIAAEISIHTRITRHLSTQLAQLHTYITHTKHRHFRLPFFLSLSS